MANRLGDVGDGLRPQVRLLTVGAMVGAVLLGVALVVDLGGFNDPEIPQVPTQLPTAPSVPALPGLSSIPARPSGLPTQFPTNLPQIPTNLPRLPTNLPSLPALPGGAP